MVVLPLTILISLILVLTFLGFYYHEHRRRAFGSDESTSLLPFLPEKTTPARRLDDNNPVRSPGSHRDTV